MRFTRDELLAAKVSEIGKRGVPSEIAFLTAVLSLGGSVPLGSGSVPAAFAHYTDAYGETTFCTTAQALIQSGVVRENDGRLELNYPPESRQLPLVAEECADTLFDTANEFYCQVLGQVTSTRDGEFALDMLVEAGVGISVERIAEAVGPTPWRTLSGHLLSTGLLVSETSSPGNGTYRLFPPLQRLALDPAVRQAVAAVYIGQNVREDGGMLWYECLRLHGLPMKRARALGFVVLGRRFPKLDTCTTSPRGDAVAREVIRERLDQAVSLRSMFKDIPMRTCQFLTDEVWTDGPHGARYRSDAWIEVGDWECHFGDQIHHYCLLNVKEIREYNRQVLQYLASAGLAIKATSYVGTRGGEERDTQYAIAPVVGEVLRDIAGLKDEEFRLPKNLEILHSIYHLMQRGRFTSDGPQGPTARGIPLSSFGAVLKDLESANLVAYDHERSEYQAKDSALYSQFLERTCFGPIVEYVLEKSTPVEPVVPPAVPPEVIKETPPEGRDDSHVKVALLIGDTDDGRPVYWAPLKEINPHVLVVGAPGVGKSQTIKALVWELRQNSISSFVVDFAGEYGGTGQKPLVGTVLKPGEGVTVNPLDLLGGKPSTTRFRVSGLLKSVYRLGDQMEATVRQAIAHAFEQAGIREDTPASWTRPVPPFTAISDYLQAKVETGTTQESSHAKKILNRLEPLFDLDVFRAESQIPFSQILASGASLVLRDLPTDETKLAVAEFVLRWLWHYVEGLGEIHGKLRLAVVLDEAHKLAYEESPVSDLLRQGRKYGASVLLSTQQPDDFEEPGLVFQNTAAKIAFQCAPKQANTMARELAHGLPTHPIRTQIEQLAKFHAVVRVDPWNQPIMVNVRPYFDR